jgi:hypothetical protein
MINLLKTLFKQAPVKNKIAANIEIKEMSANTWWS